MKIQTQTRLLVVSIVAAPLLIILTQVIYSRFLTKWNVSGLPKYEDVSVLMHENFSSQDWDSLMQNAARSRNFGDVAVFRSDLFVLYSDIAEFKPDVFTSWETILPLLEDKQFIFSSIGSDERRCYILVHLINQSVMDKLILFFLPGFIGVFFIGILAVFSLCMSIVIARTITNSVRVLENATRRIAEGELDLKVETKGNNEIISLANSINKMRVDLKEDELRRSRFIMGITHDLKTPLALIKGYAEAIEDGVTNDPASLAEASEIIVGKADQLEGMLNDLIGFVKMETGEWRTHLDKISLTAFLFNTVKSLENDVELLSHTLIYDIGLPDNIFIPMDERLVLRAFENLIHNAVRYSPQGAVIRFNAVLIANAVEITISDNGLGINKDDLPHIFEMFYRGTSSRREQGMGLGLAVMKWVIDYHGWSVSVSAEEGKGTCFVIGIPMAGVAAD